MTSGRCFFSTRRQTPNGYTIIEMIVAIGIFSFVSACASVTLATLWQAQGRMTDDLHRMASRAELTRQLRTDAHMADSAKLIAGDNGAPTGVELSHSNSLIEYRSSDHRIIRLLRVQDQVVHREVFELPTSIAVTWSLSTSTVPLLRLSFQRAEPVLDNAPLGTPETMDTLIGISAGESD